MGIEPAFDRSLQIIDAIQTARSLRPTCCSLSWPQMCRQNQSGGGRVHRHPHTHLCWDGHSHCKPEDTRIRNTYRMCCLLWPCSYDSHPLDRSHLWCPSESMPHHCLCSAETFPMGPSKKPYPQMLLLIYQLHVRMKRLITRL